MDISVSLRKQNIVMSDRRAVWFIVLVLYFVCNNSYAQQSGAGLLQEVHDNGLGNPPIGTIVAWYSDGIDVVLPSSWVRCDGQKIDDKSSKFFENTVPDLNSTGLFLRGGKNSGEYQDQDWKSFQVDDTLHDGHPASHGAKWVPKQPKAGAEVYAGNSTGQVNNLIFQFDDSEVRPKNMSVVWIIRIK